MTDPLRHLRVAFRPWRLRLALLGLLTPTGCLVTDPFQNPDDALIGLDTAADTVSDASTDASAVADALDTANSQPDAGEDAASDTQSTGGPLPPVVDLSWGVTAATGTDFFGPEFNESDTKGLGPTTGFVTGDAEGLHLGQPGNWTDAGIRTVRTFDTHLQELMVEFVWQVASCSGTGPAIGVSNDVAGAQLTQTSGNWQYIAGAPDLPGAVWANGVGFCQVGADLGVRMRFREGGGVRLTSLDGSKSLGWLPITPQKGLYLFIRNHSGGPLLVKSLRIWAPAAVADPVRVLGTQATPLGMRVDWQPGKLHGAPITELRWLRRVGGVDVLQPEILPALSPAYLPMAASDAQWARLVAVTAVGPSQPSTAFPVVQWQALAAPPSLVQATLTGSGHAGQALMAHADLVDANGDALPTVFWRWQAAPAESGPWMDLPNPPTAVAVPPPSAAGQWWHAIASAPGAADAVTAPVQVTPWLDMLNQVLLTGQSLSLGTTGTPPLSTTQSFKNLGWSSGALVPLVEVNQESPASGIGNGLTARHAPSPLDVAVTKHGVEAMSYVGLKKGTAPYALGQQQAAAVATLAQTQGRLYRPLGVAAVHGEADEISGSMGYYANDLREWQEDYEADMAALTGSPAQLPLFICQLSSYQHPLTTIALEQAEAARTSDGRIVLVTPKYMLKYTNSPHLNAASYRLLGEYYAKVIYQVSVLGVPWQPLEPVSAIRTGKVVDVQYHVPVPPLVLDTQAVVPAPNMGFEFLDDSQSAQIESVELLDAETVRIHLSQVPSGANPRVQYAINLQAGSQFGADVAGSAHGNLRDSDAMALGSGTPLHNWAIHSRTSVTASAP